MAKIAIHSPQELVPIDKGRLREIVHTDVSEEFAAIDAPTLYVALNRLNRPPPRGRAS